MSLNPSTSNVTQVADIGLIGLAVMGQNLIMNMNDHGFVVCAFNRTVSKVDDFLNGPAKGSNVVGAKTLEEFIAKLKKPRIVFMLVQAGQPVDALIGNFFPPNQPPLLEKGDILIDGGNSFYKDTMRRCADLEQKGFHFMGCGVSGGEEGARNGPSLMPGGSLEAWNRVKSILTSVAAKATTDQQPCCDYVGQNGSGHFVKMVHNGIEYGDMQLIAESYHILRDIGGYSNDQMASIFRKWNKGKLDSFLIEITAKILEYKDTDNTPLVEKIRDAAGQKGTGKWTALSALDFDIPVTLIGEAVFARDLSAQKNERINASKILEGPSKDYLASVRKTINLNKLCDQVADALFASKLVSYAQGFMLFREAAKNYKWNLNNGGIAMMWRGGCIIRSAFLQDIKKAFDKNPNLENLLLDDHFTKEMKVLQEGWRETVSIASKLGIPTPAMSTALAFYDGLRTARLPANLIQAQRDCFGAHQYELENKPGVWIHTDWLGTGGKISASHYNA